MSAPFNRACVAEVPARPSRFVTRLVAALFVVVTTAACGNGQDDVAADERGPEQAASIERTTSTTDPTDAYLDALNNALGDFDGTETGAGNDADLLRSKAIAYAALGSVLGSLNSPPHAATAHARLVALVDEAEEVHSEGADICERWYSNMGREVAGVAPVLGDDNCVGAMIRAQEASSGIWDGRKELLSDLRGDED